MTKAELIEKIAAENGLTKAAAGRVLDTVITSIKNDVAAGNKVQLIGFGTFETAKRAARTGVNPSTGEKIKIAASIAPKFKAGKAFKELVNAKPAKKSKKK